MGEEKIEGCSHDCGSCGESCGERQSTKADFLVPMNAYSNVKNVIGVVSGKGGVGKSFVTSAVAAEMARRGYRTAILDADVTGPSIPRCFGLKEKAMANEQGILPAVTQNGIKVMSVNLLLEDEEAPVVWRGPVIAGTVKQFWSEVVWGDIDYMFVDMPPGTGDVPLTVFQSLPVAGILVVTSPQELVSMIVAKAVHMAEAMEIPVLGFVENYSYVSCGKCGEQINVFGESHIDEIAAKYTLPVLAKLPIDSAAARAADAGKMEELDIDWFRGTADFLENIFAAVNASGVKGTEPEKEVLRIALPTDGNGNISGHFGHCGEFAVYEISSAGLTGKTTVSASGNGHVSAIALMKEQNIAVVICGGIGREALEGLLAEGIQVVPGLSGDMDVAVAAFLDGTAAQKNTATCDCSHDDDECTGCCSGCSGCH